MKQPSLWGERLLGFILGSFFIVFNSVISYVDSTKPSSIPALNNHPKDNEQEGRQEVERRHNDKERVANTSGTRLQE